MKLEKGYGFISVSRVSEDKHRVVQIKKEFMDKFKGIFEAEEGSFQKEVQYELNDVYDFAVSFLADVLDEKNHKIEILTKDELDKKYLS
jgi:hypothetical protein